MTEFNLENVRTAILSLSIPAQTQKANEWLMEFERRKEAWEVSFQLILEAPGSQFRFFGAKFLYSKVQRQIMQLDDGAIAGLKGALVDNILKLSQEPKIELNLCRYLCLALAALTLQMNQSGSIAQLLGLFNPLIPTAPTILLELLQALPEEAYNRQVDVSFSTREQFTHQLSETSGDVLNFLSGLWASVGTDDARCKILVCAERWIDITRTPAQSLQSTAIFQSILESLAAPATFETAADAVIAIVRRFQCTEPSLLNTVLPHVLNLAQVWHQALAALHKEANGSVAVSAEELDDDTLNACRTVCRVFTEVGEACMDLFVTSTFKDADFGQIKILTHLLECTRFPYDMSIARIPLKFFYELSLLVKNGKYSQDDFEANGHADSAYASSVLPSEVLAAQYGWAYDHLLETAVIRLRYPDPRYLTEAVAVVSEDISDVRLEWKETVMDCCFVLGGQRCLELLCMKLQASSDSDYLMVESVLVCIQAIASFLPREEKNCIPGVITYVTQLPTKCPGSPRLYVAAVELLGRFAFWIESNTAYLESTVGHLFAHLQHPLTSLVAAKATMNIFRYCNRLEQMAGAVDQLGLVVDQMRASGNPAFLESENFLLESIAVVLSRLETSQSEAKFRAAFLPVAEALQAIVVNQETTGRAGASVLPSIVRITILFRFYHSEGNVVTDLLTLLIPLFSRMLALNSSEGVCEKVSSCYKHAIRSCGKRFLPHLGLLTTHLTEQFQRLHFAAFLYASSILISSFGTAERGAYTPVLYEMIWNQSSAFFGHFPTVADFEQKPDVVEEYYFLMAKALQYCPAGFVQDAAKSGHVIECAVAGLAIRHREAQKGILLFFEKFVQLANFWPESNPLHGAVRACMVRYGGQLVAALFALLSGQMPAYAIDESNGSIGDVLWYVKKRFEKEFQVWLMTALQGLPVEAQAIAIKNALVENVMTSTSQRDFTKILDRYEMNCRRCL